MEVFKDLNHSQRSARKDRFLALGLRIQEADVLVHVEDVAVAKALHILRYIDDLLQVLVLSVVENRVVHDDAVDFLVGIGGEDGIFNVVLGDFTKSITESTEQRLKG